MHRTASNIEIGDASSFKKFISFASKALNTPGMWDFVVLSLPSAAIMWCEWWVYELQAIVAGWLGIQVLAAHVVCCNIEAMIYMVPLGVQQAAAILVGNSLGAGRPKMAIQYTQLSIICGTVLSLIVATLVISYRDVLAAIYSMDPDVLESLHSALLILGVYHVLSELNCVLEGVLLGMRLQERAVKIKVLSMLVYQLPAAYLLSLKFGLNGIWVASVSGLFVTVIGYSRVILRASFEQCAIAAMKENQDELSFQLII
jgi:MATE family multidrug resistance protein